MIEDIGTAWDLNQRRLWHIYLTILCGGFAIRRGVPAPAGRKAVRRRWRAGVLPRSALGARRSALGARRSALGARRSALGARRSALGARRSALGARRSALGARRSALGARRSALLIVTNPTASNHRAQIDPIAAPLPVCVLSRERRPWFAANGSESYPHFKSLQILMFQIYEQIILYQ